MKGGEMPENVNKMFKQRVASREGMLLPGAANALTAKIIEDMGFTLILYANAALQAAVLATQNVLKHLRDGSLDGAMDQLATFEERQRLVSKPRFDAMELKYAKAVQHS